MYLKIVMRLYKPRLYSNTSSSASVMSVPLTVADLIQQEFATSNMLILPDSFGEIFLGNTFSSYISVINQYTCDLKEVGLTVRQKIRSLIEALLIIYH
jgi:hypothetical protein